MVFASIVIGLSVIVAVLLYLVHVFRTEANNQEFKKKTKTRKKKS